VRCGPGHARPAGWRASPLDECGVRGHLSPVLAKWACTPPGGRPGPGQARGDPGRTPARRLPVAGNGGPAVRLDVASTPVKCQPRPAVRVVNCLPFPCPPRPPWCAVRRAGQGAMARRRSAVGARHTPSQAARAAGEEIAQLAASWYRRREAPAIPLGARVVDRIPRHSPRRQPPPQTPPERRRSRDLQLGLGPRAPTRPSAASRHPTFPARPPPRRGRLCSAPRGPRIQTAAGTQQRGTAAGRRRAPGPGASCTAHRA
jgi:hypothetical protein